ncbi:hypothetical protein [Propionicimonas sp.]|uniref:hypothetical protein n=1 Tax=Propionicimonas sp. TaxID=1955623 RepID=UPI0039E50244
MRQERAGDGGRMRAAWVCAVVLASLLLGGCSTGGPDAALRAVRDSRSATVGAALAGRLLREGLSTSQVTQVVLDDAVDSVAGAGTELASAADVNPSRVMTARIALTDALAVLDRLSDHGAGRFTAPDLDALDAAVAELDRAERELSR